MPRAPLLGRPRRAALVPLLLLLLGAGAAAARRPRPSYPHLEVDWQGKRAACELHVSRAGGACMQSGVERENCVLRCMSPACYQWQYGSDALEEGEVDTQRRRRYKACVIREEFEWDLAPVHFNIEEGALPEEVTVSVRARLGHSGTPEVIGFGTIKVGEALAHGMRRAAVRVPLSRHHKRNMEAEAVIEEHTGDADVVLELES
eukprot:scaffold5.g692.t1